jgi:acetylornithine/N-succinyldiaminopimelate aminotransferase
MTGASTEQGGGMTDTSTIADDHLMPTYARYPVRFVRGEGARVWDADGHEYLDFLAGISVSSVGHCHPRVVEAIRAQAGELLHVGNLFYTDPMTLLAQRLAEGSLGGTVFFTNSGAEAVEAALKLARKAKTGGEVVVLHRGFHGRTYGALSATPQESKQAPFAPLVPGFVAVEPTAEAVGAAVTERTAAVLLEPVQGESGVWPLPDELLRAAREACDAHGAALLYDEIQCGLGRCGTMWAFEQSGVVPDAMTTAKALGGGLPIGALITGERLAQTLQPGDHGSTFAGGPVVAAAAHAALDVLEDPALHARVRELGERIVARLQELPGVRAVRGRGLMVGFDITGTDAPAIVRRALLEQRLVCNATGPETIRFLPPLVIGEAEADEAVDRIAPLLADAAA